MSAAAATLPKAPKKENTTFRHGNVERVQIIVPAGHAGKTGIRLTIAHQQLLPITPGSWIITDDEVIDWPLAGFLDSGSWGVEAYNEDINAHEWFIRFLISEVGSRGTIGAIYEPGGGGVVTPIAGGGGEGEGVPGEEERTPGEEAEEEEAEEAEEQEAEEEEEVPEEKPGEEEPAPGEGEEPPEETALAEPPEQEPTLTAPPVEAPEEQPKLSPGSGLHGGAKQNPAQKRAAEIKKKAAKVKTITKTLTKLEAELKAHPHATNAAALRTKISTLQHEKAGDQTKIQHLKAAQKKEAERLQEERLEKLSPKKPTTQSGGQGGAGLLGPQTGYSGGGGGGGGGPGSIARQREHEQEQKHLQEVRKKEQIQEEQAQRTALEQHDKKVAEVARLQGEIGGLQNDIGRLQGEIDGLQNHIAQLTAVIQEHPNADKRQQWENERNGDRTNIEGKRQRIAQDQANIDHKRGEVEFWNKF